MDKQIKKIIKYLIVLIFVYLFIGILLSVFQQNMIYKSSNDSNFYDCEKYNDMNAYNYKDTRFYLKDNNSDTFVIYYHGRSTTVCDSYYLKDMFENLNYSYVFLEYTGYQDDKQPTLFLLLKDVEKLNNFLNNNFDYNNLYVIGSSLGTSPASYNTKINLKVNKVLLISPFSKISDVSNNLLPIYPYNIMIKENYDNIYFLKNYNKSLKIIHGEKDLIIPNGYSRNLFDEINTLKKEYVLIKNAKHTNLYEFQKVKEEIYKYLID